MRQYKVYIERNNLQLELIRTVTVQFVYFIHVYFYEAKNSMPTERVSGSFRTRTTSAPFLTV